MNLTVKLGVLCLAVTVGAGASGVSAAPTKEKQAALLPPVPLTATGEALKAQYEAQLNTLKGDISKALPTVEAAAMEAFVKAYQAESLALAEELKTLRASAKAKDKDAAAKAYDEAKAALAEASVTAQAPAAAVLKQMDTFLASNALDAPLVKAMVLSQATPHGLAAFTQGGDANKALADALLADDDMMKQMLQAGGAREGRYGEAMAIYAAIQKASPKAADGVLQRLALGTALEHAMPIAQANPAAVTNGPAFVDPVNRYLHFEKAYLDGELDPSFTVLTAWDLRNVVNGDEPDATLAWGREMLRNYRPDHIHTADTRWRYVKAVKTEVRYGSDYDKFDKPEFQKYQNMIMNGGVCGRRAFFGRFILRAFGIPTLARPQPGHATLTHWSPEGWVINLGAGWGWGWLKDGTEDRDFLLHTQARAVEGAFLEVLRAQWIATLVGEPDVLGFHDEPSGFWNGLALYRQRAIADEAKAVALAAVGTDIGEANESKEKDVVESVDITADDRRIVAGTDGSITIPAVACSRPTASTAKIIFMKSALGGLQLHYNRTGEPETFEYTIDVAEAGPYALSARVVTVTGDQHLRISVNGAEVPVDMVLPLTMGMWDTSAAVVIPLIKGRNTLTFSRSGDNIRGVTIKDFMLKRSAI